MFGIKTKKTYIFALILGIIGVVVLCLKIFKVLPEKDMYTLLALIFLLSAFALYLRPKMKLMKAQTAILQEYSIIFSILMPNTTSLNFLVNSLILIGNSSFGI